MNGILPIEQTYGHKTMSMKFRNQEMEKCDKNMDARIIPRHSISGERTKQSFYKCAQWALLFKMIQGLRDLF